MKDEVNFKFPETLNSKHIPHISLQIFFEGTATWVEEAEMFAINRVFWNDMYGKGAFIITPQDFTPELTLALQQQEPGDFGRFLSKCRTEAHKAATEAGFFDTERPNLRKPIMRAEMSDAHNT